MPSSDTSHTPPRKHHQHRGIKPSDVIDRVIHPAQVLAKVGDASDFVEKHGHQWKEEKMFQYYADSSEFEAKGPHDDTASEVSFANSFNRSLLGANLAASLKWVPNGAMPVWGGASHTTRNAHGSPIMARSLSGARSVASSDQHSMISNSSFFSSSNRSMDLARLTDKRESREAPLMPWSQGATDPANLSKSMQKSLSRAEQLGTRRKDKDSDEDEVRSDRTHEVLPGDSASTPHSPRGNNSPWSVAKRREWLMSSQGSVKSMNSVLSHHSERSLKLETDLSARLMSSTSLQTSGEMFGEFFFLKDSLDAEGGVQVGFGGLSMLQDHVVKGKVDYDTVLVVEVEFCTHGFEGQGAERAAMNPNYSRYMAVCDEIEHRIYPKWNVSFVIKGSRPRLGSFEIRLLWLVGSVEYTTTLHSKQQAHKFPNPSSLAERLYAALEG